MCAQFGRIRRVTRVGIVGAGPAGLTLGRLLERRGVESIIVEARSQEYVEQRVRAGVLEQNTVDLLHELGVGERLGREGLEHHGVFLRHRGENHYVDMTGLTGRSITVYGQQEVVKDLIAARSGELRFETPVSAIDPATGRITLADGEVLECDVIAGCDGFHGVCRDAIADRVDHDYTYPFGWLGILAHAAPATRELIYAWHEQGFALYSMRSDSVSRLYLQVPADEDIAAWPDDRIWAELETRLGDVNRGEIFDKGITPMRCCVSTPMQHERLFLCGDAAHIVPPTGAKGLNLAVNDARLLDLMLAAGYTSAYTETALRRVWRAQDFSNYMTQLLHRLSDDDFEAGLQRSRLEYVARSEAAARSLAENYVGLPAEEDF
jgi:p-hydroxybenzoate 3-monooxygenase